MAAMTDRYGAYIVVLDQDYRDDSGGEHVLDAIRMIKGVIKVEPVVSTYEMHMAHARRDREWATRLLKLAEEGPGG